MHGASKEEQALRLIGAGLMWLILKRVAAGPITEAWSICFTEEFLQGLDKAGLNPWSCLHTSETGKAVF